MKKYLLGFCNMLFDLHLVVEGIADQKKAVLVAVTFKGKLLITKMQETTILVAVTFECKVLITTMQWWMNRFMFKKLFLIKIKLNE
jgi:hypothetical protein